MLKKRIIFSLLYDDGFFVQSRNFDKQKVGDLNWLIKKFKIENVSYYIDELIILDVSKKKDKHKFTSILKEISKFFFVPIAAGGGISSFNDASNLLSNGADKVLVNSILTKDSGIIKKISSVYGSQSIIAAVDIKKINSKYSFFINNGDTEIKKDIKNYIKLIEKLSIGELMLQSIDQDGTGMGADLNSLSLIPNKFSKPIILTGGFGNMKHFADALSVNKIQAIATSNLFNFIGDGFKIAREDLSKKFNLAKWNPEKIKKLKGRSI